MGRRNVVIGICSPRVADAVRLADFEQLVGWLFEVSTVELWLAVVKQERRLSLVSAASLFTG